MGYRIILENKDVRNTVLLWMALWLTISAGLSYGLAPLGIDYLHNYEVTAAYFLLFTALGLYRYRINSLCGHHAPFPQQLLLIVAAITGTVGSGLVLNSVFPLSDGKLQEVIQSGLVFPLFNVSTWVVKLADITFQQVFIFALIRELQPLIPDKKKLTLTFGFVFLILHLPLLITLQLRGLYFILPSVFAGLIFCHLILHYKKGLFWSYLLHLGFYFVLGLMLRYLF